MNTDIVKIGLLVIRDGRILLCRKKQGTTLLILPGGRPESGESDEACLLREIAEELGPDVRVQLLGFIGLYRDEAAGAPGKIVEVRLWQGNIDGSPFPHAEIAELVWLKPGTDWDLLAPSLRNHIVPDLIRRGLFPALL